jgi:hypothetical protein
MAVQPSRPVYRADRRQLFGQGVYGNVAGLVNNRLHVALAVDARHQMGHIVAAPLFHGNVSGLYFRPAGKVDDKRVDHLGGVRRGRAGQPAGPEARSDPVAGVVETGAQKDVDFRWRELPGEPVSRIEHQGRAQRESEKMPGVYARAVRCKQKHLCGEPVRLFSGNSIDICLLWAKYVRYSA